MFSLVFRGVFCWIIILSFFWGGVIVGVFRRVFVGFFLWFLVCVRLCFQGVFVGFWRVVKAFSRLFWHFQRCFFWCFEAFSFPVCF